MTSAKTLTRPFLECFYALADVNSKIRHSATRDLVKHLVDNRASMGNNMGVDEQKSVGLKYAIKRLIRGLCSSRGAARQGFSLALSEVLRAFPENNTISTKKKEEKNKRKEKKLLQLEMRRERERERTK